MRMAARLWELFCGHDGRRGYIYHVAVDENYRRKGIGRNWWQRLLMD